MLQTQAVADSTYTLLRRLMSDARLDDFFLAGGTNLALQLRHRLCIDVAFLISTTLIFPHKLNLLMVEN
jgi:hypothetical protein